MEKDGINRMLSSKYCKPIQLPVQIPIHDAHELIRSKIKHPNHFVPRWMILKAMIEVIEMYDTGKLREGLQQVTV